MGRLVSVLVVTVLSLSLSIACSRREGSAQALASAQPSRSAPAAPVVTGSGEPPTVDAEPFRVVPEAAKGPARYRVFGVLANDVLNVRAAPDHKSVKVQQFPPEASGVKTTSRFETVGSELWVQVEVAGALGWVNRAFLAELPPVDACTDPQLVALVAQLGMAVARRDGVLLASLLTPARPLIIRHAWWNPSVRFDAAAVTQLFTSPASRDWGNEDSYEATISGSFAQLFLPGLTRATAASAVRKCGEIVGGSTVGTLKWPDEMEGLSLHSFYAPAPDGLNWVSWVAGVEYVNKTPYLAALVQYQHEV